MDCKIVELGEWMGHTVLKFQLMGENLQNVEILNFGGIVHSWYCEDKAGKWDDILLGCSSYEGYFERHPYFGAIVGRYANRIGFGSFSIEGHSYTLNQNLPPHHLHGGVSGFDRKFYDYTVDVLESQVVLTLSTVSHHMEEGYPGELRYSVTYTYDSLNRLTIHYRAETSEPTHINLTHHGYYNLGGQHCPHILNHEIKLYSHKITEVDSDLLPTGKIITVIDTPLDVREFCEIGSIVKSHHSLVQMAKGLDHNYILDNNFQLALAAEVRHAESGRYMKVFTDQPALQCYTGNWLEGVKGKTGHYADYAGFCLETQHYPDSPHRPEFPSTLLRPGKVYETTTIYQIGIS